jgi:hypothetical protein
MDRITQLQDAIDQVYPSNTYNLTEDGHTILLRIKLP